MQACWEVLIRHKEGQRRLGSVIHVDTITVVVATIALARERGVRTLGVTGNIAGRSPRIFAQMMERGGDRDRATLEQRRGRRLESSSGRALHS